MKIYISGPISGTADYKERFQAAEERLKKQYPGAEIVNPAKIGSMELAWEQNMRLCVKALADCDAAYFLDGWRISKGAVVESYLAAKLGIWRYQEK